MAYVKLYDRTGDQAAQKTQDRIEQSLGLLPEAYQAMGRSGEFLDAVLKLERAAGNNLPEKTRQLITIAVSATNGCSYCVDAHRALALKAGASEEEVSASIEVAAMMSTYNNFIKGIGLMHDITADALGVAG